MYIYERVPRGHLTMIAAKKKEAKASYDKTPKSFKCKRFYMFLMRRARGHHTYCERFDTLLRIPMQSTASHHT